jgi:glycosyltransferase involved in cell wall biosynthesis
MREALALRIAPRAKLFVLGDGSSNGVNTDRFAPGRSYVRDRLKIPKGDPVLGFVGRLTVDKGIPELLTAFDEILAHHPNCWLVLVGWFDRAEDALGARWRRHIEEHPRIRKTDFVANPEDYYRAMDVLILPTHREGFPNVVLEAAACGLPVITTETTGARDAVIPEVTGLLIPPGYPEAIVAAARSLLDDEQGCIRMGRAARKWVLERFSDERVLSLAVRFYTSRLTPEEAVDLGPFAEESA